jgi:DNA-binding beta-propeller fold protein YncE
MFARTLVGIIALLAFPGLALAQGECPITFDRDLSEPGSLGGQLSDPRGVAVDGRGYLYVVDRGNFRVQKFNRDGMYVTQWGVAGQGNGEFSSPIGIAISSDYRVYVVDQELSRVQQFDSLGTYLGQWGTSGEGAGQFFSPIGIAVDGNGSVYVTDTGNQRVQKFDAEGNYITQWGTFGSGDGMFYNPFGIAVDGSGSVYVADKLNFRVQKFDGSGNFLDKWGTFGSQAGQLRLPSGLAVDPAGDLYVADWENFRVSKFTGEGQFLTQCTPQGGVEWVALDQDGDLFVTADGFSVIQKFVGAASTRALSTPARTYRGVSFPLLGQGASVDAILTPQLGPRDETKWRLGRWDPIGGRYVSAEDGNLTSVSAGLGYWLITSTPENVNTAGCAPPEGEIAIPLPGPNGSWHQLGNPYLNPVPASTLEVRTTGGRRFLSDPFNSWTSTNIWVYDGSPYNPNPSQIPALSMFWVRKDTDIAVDVIVPRPALGPFPVFASSAPRSDGLWEIGITASQGASRAAVTVGAVSDVVERSSWRIALPPSPPGPQLRLAILSGEHDVPQGDHLLDFRTPAEVMAWDLTLRGSGEIEPVTLEFAARGLHDGVHIVLSDPETGVQWNVSPSTAMSVVAGSGVRSLRLTVEPASTTSPPLNAAFRVYPNPSRSAAALLFTRSQSGPVRADIYDVTGRKVKELRLPDAPRGEVLVPWDGRDDQGRDVGSGVFFARCTAAAESETVRIVRVR